MNTDPRTSTALAQSGKSQAIDAPRQRRYPKRVLSALTERQRAEALAWLRVGRSVHVVAHELSVSAAVILELWLRNLESQLRRAA